MSKTRGLLWAGLGGLVAIMLGDIFPLAGSGVCALLLGMLSNHVWDISSETRVGLDYAGKKLLQAGIVVLGFTLPFSRVSQLGVSSLGISVITISLAFITAYLVGKKLGLKRNLKILIGFGTAICGGSAIAAASPIIEAEEEDIALSLSTIFAFNLAAIFIFPAIGHLLKMSASEFGLWAGTAINDTSSVVAAGYAYSQSAGDFATIVKLARAMMILPATLLLFIWRWKKEKSKGQKFAFKKIFPWFILLFVLASFVSSFNIIPTDIISVLKTLSQLLMAMALISIGSKVSIERIRDAGWSPLGTGLVTWSVVAVASLILQYFVF